MYSKLSPDMKEKVTKPGIRLTDDVFFNHLSLLYILFYNTPLFQDFEIHSFYLKGYDPFIKNFKYFSKIKWLVNCD